MYCCIGLVTFSLTAIDFPKEVCIDKTGRPTRLPAHCCSKVPADIEGDSEGTWLRICYGLVKCLHEIAYDMRIPYIGFHVYTPYSINKKMIVATDRFRFGKFFHWKAEGFWANQQKHLKTLGNWKTRSLFVDSCRIHHLHWEIGQKNMLNILGTCSWDQRKCS